MDLLTVRDYDGKAEELLIDFDYGSFSYSYEKNASRQITFDAYRTDFNSYSYDLLQVEATITYQGQEYVVKQCDPSLVDNVERKAVTAYHVTYTFQDWCQYSVKEGEKTYTIDQVLSFGFSGNPLGFRYVVKGSFAKVQIENLGNVNGVELLNLVAEKFNAIYFADNRVITFYDEASFYKDSNKVFRYLYNTDEIKVTTSTANLKTVIKVYGKTKEDADKYSGDAKYMAVTTYTSSNVSKYGKRYANSQQDERYTNVSSLTEYAKSLILDVPETTLSLSVTALEDVNERDSWHFINEALSYDTTVKVVQLRKGHAMAAQKPEVVFSNTKKDMMKIQKSIADTARKARDKVANVVNTASSAQRIASQAYDSMILTEKVGEVEE
ncbi:phage tail protein [Listeria ilorinensis]|uniref:phage tail protein n=1 Tax=Listeria ilorinensis TaxID=2867439 RepID=UPI001EF524A6|nr:phage tail protein [Listeria ilorinensis]